MKRKTKLVLVGQATLSMVSIGYGLKHAIKLATPCTWAVGMGPTMAEETREQAVQCWVWKDGITRAGLSPHLKHIGGGYRVRENNGEIYEAVEDDKSPLYRAAD